MESWELTPILARAILHLLLFRSSGDGHQGPRSIGDKLVLIAGALLGWGVMGDGAICSAAEREASEGIGTLGKIVAAGAGGGPAIFFDRTKSCSIVAHTDACKDC